MHRYKVWLRGSSDVPLDVEVMAWDLGEAMIAAEQMLRERDVYAVAYRAVVQDRDVDHETMEPAS